MNNSGLIIILFVMLTAGCANRNQVVTPSATVGFIAPSLIPNSAIHKGTRVVINLSEQRAYLIEDGKVSLISPIASGKPGYSTPTGSFSILSKDIDHRSQSFGSIFDSSGRIANSNATPGTYVPPGDYYRPAPMPYYMQFGPALGMHAGYLPGYPASHGCVRMPRDLAARFFERVSIRTPVTVDGNTRELTSVRKAIPLF